MPQIRFRLPLRARTIILALAKALIVEPEDLVIHNKEEELLRRCQILYGEMPLINRWLILLLLYTFDRATFLLGFGMLRFCHLRPEAQRRYADVWLKSPRIVMVEMFKALRGLIMVCYFSNPEVWLYIGYDPRRHVDERIKLRREILARDGAAVSDVPAMKSVTAAGKATE